MRSDKLFSAQTLAIFTPRTSRIPERNMSKERNNLTLQYNLENLYKLSVTGDVSDRNLLSMLHSFKEGYYIDEAIEVAKLAVRLYPYQAEFAIELAALMYNDQDYLQTLDVVEKALLINPCHGELEVLRVRVLCKLGRLSEAQEILDNLCDYIYDPGLINIAQCYVCEQRRDFHSMQHFAEQAIICYPDSEDAFELYTTAIDALRCYKEAIYFLNDCIDEDPYSHLAWYHLAQAHANLAHYDRAILAYEYSFIANPDFLRAYLECAELCTELGYWRRSIIVNLDIVERFGDNADCRAQMAKAYLHLRMITPALKCLDKLSRIDRDHEELYFLMGDCFFVQKEWGKAAMTYKKALRADDSHDEYIFRLARACAKLGKSKEAFALFERAIELGPEQDEYWFGFAKFLLRKNKLNYALRILDEAQLHTFSSKLDYLRSVALLRTNKRREGLEFLSAALEEDQGHLKLFYKYLPEARSDQQIQSLISYFS